MPSNLHQIELTHFYLLNSNHGFKWQWICSLSHIYVFLSRFLPDLTMSSSDLLTIREHLGSSIYIDGERESALKICFITCTQS